MAQPNASVLAIRKAGECLDKGDAELDDERAVDIGKNRARRRQQIFRNTGDHDDGLPGRQQ